MATPADHLGLDLLVASEMGLTDIRPAGPRRFEAGRLVVAIPVKALDVIRDALFEAGAGTIGTYERCSFYTHQIATYIPRGTAQPTVGVIGEEERVGDYRLEVRYPLHREVGVLEALRAANPYDEPAAELSRVTAVDWQHQSGAVGTLRDREVHTVLTDLGLLPAARSRRPDMPSVAVFTECGAPVDKATVVAASGDADYIVPELLSWAVGRERSPGRSGAASG